jgi:hypothetical protein
VNNYYITRDEHGYHCMVNGQCPHISFTLDSAMSYMTSQGFAFDVRTASDSGKPTWWYVK